uniref:Uncharacterized protein n=1 Tax=Chaetoceros debilis TaxID=122233 RepID=A0A7S3Q6P0_9STRA|mmetsp:Transcript_10244/g.15471  ORF Transcript_10244/g.15471 Transcript_10244/m.15471 type:complete len:123 (+) Transcript_10244:48-416(+)
MNYIQSSIQAYDLSKTPSGMTAKSDDFSEISIDMTKTSNPPPNVADGGLWGTSKLRSKTGKHCVGFRIPGLGREVAETYAVWGKARDEKGNEVGKRDIFLYDSEGNLLGPRKKFRWVPSQCC